MSLIERINIDNNIALSNFYNINSFNSLFKNSKKFGGTMVLYLNLNQKGTCKL